MKRTILDLWVGFFVALGIGALAFLSFQVANLTSLTRGATYEVSARFDDVGGLKVQAPVKSAGVLVGRITGISFDNTSFEAVVQMSIEQRFHFPSDTSARILTAGLLGDQYMGLSAGAEADDLENGSVIEITQGAVVLEKLIGQFLYSKTTESEPAK
ncbi:MAG: outer membrane lipid asymmetry maintenance protein MlaD [Gammaproteobacteria bacterium]|jgi:phospholipid/cholesterol/gamma-HCH transport system substrate-binding protein|nr:outer membrane lipid asymmetry maintenance protein MlaD [Gammaproteobacteria bacterium]MBP6052111.1 outer membrane lipid asymmetry maintenance protein MlaD [Pseudomonadales bacterium]MBK7521554.1 outer membrane lipid asymmetry maintenance protein MlaD [Gammaproteobacteria bacterium]MBK7729328.1 outer membrane lipid asymmetry maintenance protein MlaD [Gammaproteobacteria bacterium]MBK8307635.1 outer membrane lipid asymmetry maintenance protein MlaD [Gammaproteobacteria bacterium]